MTEKSASRKKQEFPPTEWEAGSAVRKPGIFGTLFQPIARWWCSICDSANISRLLVPIRPKELVPCKGCHRMTTLTVEVDKLPQAWGGPVADTEKPAAPVQAEGA